MASREWQLDRPGGQCSVTGRVFEEGDEFYSVIFEDGESFRRVDFGMDAWTEPPEGCFCHYKTRVPPAKRKVKQLLVSDEALETFFRRLAGEDEPLRVGFRFVLALLLMRKRLLRYEGSRKESETEVWDMTLGRDQSRHEVINPHLSDEQVTAVSGELMVILHGDAQEDVLAHEAADGSEAHADGADAPAG